MRINFRGNSPGITLCVRGNPCNDQRALVGSLLWLPGKLPEVPGRFRASVVVAAVALLASAPARGQETITPDKSAVWDETAAKLHYDKGTAAYALGDFVEAAYQYEAAFRLKADPALLFNAAQAHRRAGNRRRAMELYQNLLRVFPTAKGHQVARQHLDELRRSVAMEPPGTSDQLALPPPVLTEGQLPPEPARPAFYYQTWFLATVSAVVVAGVVTAAVLSVGNKPARPSWGQVGP